MGANLIATILQSKGVRVWFAPHDMPIGARIRDTIDESIKVYDKLMVVLSENSIDSDWVEKEVETAFEKERQLAKHGKKDTTVLFPIKLDDTVMETGKAWAADLRRMRNIGDFRGWKNHDKYQKALERLMRDLKPGEHLLD